MLRNNVYIRQLIGFFIIFLILIIIGCERKTESPSMIQTEFLNSVNPTVFERSTKEVNLQIETVSNISTDDIKIELVLRREPLLNDITVHVDRDTTELYFYKTIIFGIDGMEQLDQVETIVFHNVSHLSDFSFLSEVSSLRNLYIISLIYEIDWSFIQELSDLEVLIIEAYRQATINIDLINNRNLEYIGISHSSLESFPLLHNEPNSLKYLNLQSNRITSLPIDLNIPFNATVLLRLNPYEKDLTTPENFTMESVSRVISEERFRTPSTIPSHVISYLY